MILISRNRKLPHEFNFIVREHEIVIIDSNFKEVATITVETMDKDVEKDGKWVTEPTENFWISFNPEENSGIKNSAEVWINKPIIEE